MRRPFRLTLLNAGMLVAFAALALGLQYLLQMSTLERDLDRQLQVEADTINEVRVRWDSERGQTIIVDLERMADHAEGIAKIAVMLADEAPLKPYVDIPRMAEIARRMLIGSLEAFKDRDAVRARAICNDDDEVDALYDQVYREVVDLMLENPANVERATHLTWVAHNLERIADRVTNICERVVYLVEGKIQELNVSTY